MANPNSALPRRKVGVAAVAGAMTTLFIYLVQQITGRDVPAEAAAALTTLLSFGVAWLTPAEDQDEESLEMTPRQEAVLKHLLDEAPDPPGWEPEIPPRPSLRRPHGTVPHG